MRIDEARARKLGLLNGAGADRDQGNESRGNLDGAATGDWLTGRGEVSAEEVPGGDERPSAELPSKESPSKESPGKESLSKESLSSELEPPGVGAPGDRAVLVTALDLPAPSFVGIVPSDHPDGFRLAVRYIDPIDEAEVARVQRVAGADVDIRVVGPIRALTSAPPATDDASNGSADPATGPVTGEPAPPMDYVPPTPEELQQRVRPLVRGLSVAQRDVTAGTIGTFVKVADSDATHLLSNNHVLGDSDRAEPGDDVLQPGPADGGTSTDRVGQFLRAVRLESSATNFVDCALAVLDDDVEVDLNAHDGPIIGVVEAVDVTGSVAKIGRTTGYTIGRITAIEVDGVRVGYDTGVFSFDDQIEIEGVEGGFSAGGDSGSVIYTPDDRLGVGLLFAGSTSGGSGGTGVTYANPLSAVLAALGASLP